MDRALPTLCGTHHVRLPVRDIDRSLAWYADLLGYERDFPFKDGERVLGWAIKHPRGGPSIVLMLDPERAVSSSGFPFFAFGLPDEEDVRQMERRLDERGVRHGGFQKALVGIKLPFVEDPDGHLLGFYVVRERGEQRK
jgi:catechol 2,3-dioxygenase-like lactoylglutathione lyase family enzyme